MAKLLVKGEWYEAVSPTALYEEEYERAVLEYGALLYPDYIAVEFKTLVFSEEGSAKPDLALIRSDYLDWWVVEFERAGHSLAGHVLPQIRTLSLAAYGPSEARYLVSRSPALDVNRLTTMMKGKPPGVLVVVNSHRPDWVTPLKRYDARLMVVELFRSGQNDRVIRVNGEGLPSVPQHTCECFFERGLPRFLTVAAPTILAPVTSKWVAIHYQGQVTEWERVEIRDRVWLAPVGPNPLDPRRRYVLARRSDGAFEIAGPP